MTNRQENSENADSAREQRHINPLNMKRTILGVAIGALLAMSFVPYVTHGRRGYLPIYEAGDENINVAQLILNVCFAALIGALVANLRRLAIWAVAIVALAVGAAFGIPAYQEHMKSAAEHEEWAAHIDIANHKFAEAKNHLLKAADYWTWKGWLEGGENAKKRALDESGIREEARRADENRPQLTKQFSNPFEIVKKQAPPSFDPNRPFTVEDVLGPPLIAYETNPNSPNFGLVTDRSSIYFGLTIDEARRQETARQRELNQQKSRQQEEQKRREDDLCNNALHAVPWHHQTSDGKTFMCADFYEHRPGDRKGELDEAARQTKARFYREDLEKRKKEGGIYHVIVYFYK